MNWDEQTDKESRTGLWWWWWGTSKELFREECRGEGAEMEYREGARRGDDLGDSREVFKEGSGAEETAGKVSRENGSRQAKVME